MLQIDRSKIDLHLLTITDKNDDDKPKTHLVFSPLMMVDHLEKMEVPHLEYQMAKYIHINI